MANTYKLWDMESDNEYPVLTHYKPDKQRSEWTILIFPGGGYDHHAKLEGGVYAQFLNQHGFNAFVLHYRVYPDVFPAPLNDARRAIRYIRSNADKLGVKKDKIAVMGSSAGGHLAALVSNYKKTLDNEPYDSMDLEDCIPNAQILCYPVIRLVGEFAHVNSGKMLLGDRYDELAEKLSVDSLVTEETPPAFVWHTFADDGVSVLNSLSYVTELKKKNVRTEYHIFPDGRHGLGLANQDKTNPVLCAVSQWNDLLVRWLESL